MCKHLQLRGRLVQRHEGVWGGEVQEREPEIDKQSNKGESGAKESEFGRVQGREVA